MPLRWNLDGSRNPKQCTIPPVARASWRNQWLYPMLLLGALAGAVIVLGWPAFLGAFYFCYRYVPRRLRQLGVDVDAMTQRR